MRGKLGILIFAAAWVAAPVFASELGKVDFPTSGPAAAQEHFLRGVAALHSFWYDEAADEFRAAQKLDPGFAMAYWGEALTYNHPIWREQDMEAARAVLGRLAPTAQERAAKAPTERERAWLGAVEALYGEGEMTERDRAYMEAMRRLYERWPDDLEAAGFYSLSLIGPALIGNGAFGEPRDHLLMRAAGILEELFDRNPQHPGVLHYLIHAYDDPTHAPLGLRAARIYAQVAPAAHHALHMPSHIFVQLGRWPDVVASNEAAWAASVAWTGRRGLPLDKRDFHSLSWLAYAYLQQGRVGKAEEVLEIARQAARESDSPRIAGSLESMEARHLVETRAWSTAKAAAAGTAGAEAGGMHCGGGGHAGESGAAVFAAGLAAAKRGDLAAADEAIARLRTLPKGGPRGYGSDALGVMEKEISALVLLARGRSAEALEQLAEAARAEEAMSPPSGPPDLLKPALELYGEALLEQNRPAEALQQLDKSLLRMPNRAASLLGAARAAVRLGRTEEARARYAALAEIWQQADTSLPDLAEVRSFLASRPAR